MDWRHWVAQQFSTYSTHIVARPKLYLLLPLLCAAFLASQLPKLRLDTSTEGFLKNEDPALLAYESFREQFGRDEQMVLAVVCNELFTPINLKRLSQLHHRLEQDVPFVAEVNSLVNGRITYGAENELIIEDLLTRLPNTPQQANLIRQKAENNTLFNNYLLSEDGSVAALYVRLQTYAPLDTNHDASQQKWGVLSENQIQQAGRQVNQIAQDFSRPECQSHADGFPIMIESLRQSV